VVSWLHTMLRFVLASQSPRRSHVLKEAGFRFTVDHVKVSEIIDENLNPETAVLALAKRKCNSALMSDKYLESPGYLLLAADTMVALDGQSLGSPRPSCTSIQTVAFARQQLSDGRHFRNLPMDQIVIRRH
jgi:predicted house-cleaning NTP pyrophosphatase (Maf/HAM1 superfamily)